MPPRQAFLGLGANLGAREEALAGALRALAAAPGVARLEASRIYETDPVGVTDQPAFLNLAAGVETTLSPEQLHQTCLAIERAAGRARARERRWGPRTLDIDLLLFEGETRHAPELTLPHPRLWERAFVTEPLRELLARVPAFQYPTWAELRVRLAALPASPQGVKLWRGKVPGAA